MSLHWCGWMGARPAGSALRCPENRGKSSGVRVAGELERYSRQSLFTDDDLLFANPTTGAPMNCSKVRKRFVAACRRAHVREVRFHDLRHTLGTHLAGERQDVDPPRSRGGLLGVA